MTPISPLVGIPGGGDWESLGQVGCGLWFSRLLCCDDRLLIEMALCSYGGREEALKSRTKEGGREMVSEVKAGIGSAEQMGREVVGEAKAKAAELKDKIVR